MLKTIYCLFILISLNTYSQTQDSFVHDGEERNFVYFVPSNWTNENQMPLLIVLHGLTQTGNGIMDITEFNTIAEDNGFVVCYPDGLNNSWNADMNSLNSEVDDLGFIEALAGYFENNYNTNSRMRYLTGFSNGGFLSHKIASESEMCFAAIATVAGTMSTTTAENFNPSHPTSVLHIHGTNDGIVPYGGGASTGASVEQILSFWQSHLSCDSEPLFVPMSNPEGFDFSYPEKYVYQNCIGAELEHIKVVGGGHQWPGIETLFGGLGTINMDFYSPQVIWDFLQNKSCPETNGIDEEHPLSSKKLIKTTDALGREVEEKAGVAIWYLYDDGSVEKRFEILE